MEARAAAAREAVLAQTDFLHAQFGKVESRWKSDGTRVTAADIAISEGVFAFLGARFPEDQFFSEELNDSGSPIEVRSRFAWILDPIDGTNNFALGIPHCAIALALVDNGIPVYGAIYDLSRRVLMHGGPAFGAWNGDHPCRVSTTEPRRESLIGFHSPYDKALVEGAKGVLSQFKIRGLGSATLHLAYVAAGLLDGAIDYNVKIWDLAAAIPLCEAAGGEVRFLNGPQLPIRQFNLRMSRIIYVAGCPGMCDQLAKLTGKVS
jgi:myo-inositol-1(or 4)-monophosphatase